jgi:hypothetical protein
MNQEWAEMVAREGTAMVASAPMGPADDDEDAELPCPACGTAAPLVDGACSDCGLHLE